MNPLIIGVDDDVFLRFVDAGAHTWMGHISKNYLQVKDHVIIAIAIESKSDLPVQQGRNVQMPHNSVSRHVKAICIYKFFFVFVIVVFPKLSYAAKVTTFLVLSST